MALVYLLIVVLVVSSAVVSLTTFGSTGGRYCFASVFYPSVCMFPSALSTGDCSVSFCPCMVSVVGVLIDCCSCGMADSTLLFLLLLRGAGGRDCFDYLPVVFSRCWDCSLSVCLSAISTGFGLNSCAVAGGWCCYFPFVVVLRFWNLSFVDVTTCSTRFCV